MQYPSPSVPAEQSPAVPQAPRPAGPARPVEAITALVVRDFRPATHLLPVPEKAAEGDVVGMKAVYRANLEQWADLQRTLRGFFVQTAGGPAFRVFNEIASAPAAPIAADLALERLYLCADIHRIVRTHRLMPDPFRYKAYAVTFADARIVVWSGMLTCTALRDPLGWEAAPDMRPLLVEVPSGMGDAEALALAERRVALFRQLLPAGVDFDVRIAGYAVA